LSVFVLDEKIEETTATVNSEHKASSVKFEEDVKVPKKLSS